MFHALTRDSGSGLIVYRRDLFTGYGCFEQVHKDIVKSPHFGVNLIKAEIGMHSVFKEEGAPQLNNFAVNLLIKLSHFPEWVLKKYPHLNQHVDDLLYPARGHMKTVRSWRVISVTLCRTSRGNCS